jgi:hypothetical protein
MTYVMPVDESRNRPGYWTLHGSDSPPAPGARLEYTSGFTAEYCCHGMLAISRVRNSPRSHV